MRIKHILGAALIAAFLAFAVAAPQPAMAWGGGCGSYVVQRGDTLSSIAARYGTTVDAMRQANPNLGYWLYAGQTITIPCGYNGGYQDGGCASGCGYQDGGYYGGNNGCGWQGCDGYQGSNYGCGWQGCDGYGYQGAGWGGYGYQGQGWNDGGYHGDQGNWNGGCSTGCGYGYGNGTYVVQRGDTLARIAARFGTTWYQLCVLNGLWNPNVIYVGQVLRVQ